MKQEIPERFDRRVLLELYDRLLGAYGPQGWWPAESRFEVLVGAVLTQNTAWTNAERAIVNLKRHDKLCSDAIIGVSLTELAGLIHPSGYYNVKSKRLKNLCSWVRAMGGLQQLAELTTGDLRHGLLKVNGIGPETADDILLYAFERPVFVIDAYTRRLLRSLDLIHGDEPYEHLRRGFETCLDLNARMFNEYHALIVRHAKQKCRMERDCRHCHVEQA